ncbi:alpha/beta hydrolase family protein [Flavisphingopyxis soli]|nr:alpha/beta hydrolase [Sphingorhabdus soli]
MTDTTPTDQIAEPAPAVPMQWGDLLERAKPAPDATISYGTDPLNVVDIWQPAGKGPHPAVIMIHGGCWKTDIAQRDIMNYIAADLRSDGIGVWNIEYRGVDRAGGGYPGSYQDVGEAADLFAARGAGFGFDTTKRVAIGHSAGGHLALWLAQRPALPTASPIRGARPIALDAAISQAGIPDLRQGETLPDHPCGDAGARAMAAGHYAETAPQEMPLTDTPQYLFNTSADWVAPYAYGEAYRDAMAKRGKSVVLAQTAGEGHVEHIAPEGKTWALQKALIKQLLGMK